MLLEDSTRWALRHPLTSGLLFAAVGIAMIADVRADGEILWAYGVWGMGRAS